MIGLEFGLKIFNIQGLTTDGYGYMAADKTFRSIKVSK